VARLRIRVELSRGGLGVPLHKVASVISQSQKFMDLLGEDVHIDRSKGEWLAFDFDRESLNFTAEYVGPVTAQQVGAFNAAFDGTTSLRRDTIAQFASITDAIGEDEIIGFGLYQNDEIAEPTEWRCLSRRDALRIADGIQLLLGENQESHLPAARDPSLGARIFGDRRDGGVEHSDRSDAVREIERSLTTRIQRVENRMEQHAELIQDLRAHSASTESSFRNLLSTVESFCDQATRRIEMASPAALPRWPAEPRPKRLRRWMIVASALAGSVAIVAASAWLWPAHPAAQTKKEPAIVSAKLPNSELAAPPLTLPEPTIAAASAPAVPKPVMRIDLDATAPTWVSLVDEDGNRVAAQLLVPGSPRTFELEKGVTLRTGNAGGLVLRVNGRPVGSLGTAGQVRQIQIKAGKVLASPTSGI
jgi:hypothetical protein